MHAQKYLNVRQLQKYLDTEDEGIIKECQDLVSKGLNIIKRPPELASNYIGANELIAFALHSMPYCDLILQTFATTPLITSKTIDFCRKVYQIQVVMIHFLR